jgi:phosphoadenosine phosphosulfate reductase
MWCPNCNTRTSNDICENCHTETIDVPSAVYWCQHCKSPIIVEEFEKLTASIANHKCPCCGMTIFKLSSDLRPVFPEERLLIKGLLQRFSIFEKYSNLLELLDNAKVSVWINIANILYLDGVSHRLPAGLYESFYALSEDEKTKLREEIFWESNAIDKNEESQYGFDFEQQIKLFCKVNEIRRVSQRVEAENFINNTVKIFSDNNKKNRKNEQRNNNVMVSFSGGKDSTVVSDLVIKSLSDPMIPHIFGDTTLEIPSTYEYVEQSRQLIPCLIKAR